MCFFFSLNTLKYRARQITDKHLKKYSIAHLIGSSWGRSPRLQDDCDKTVAQL